MSDMEVITKFELLSNEIYVYSFDQLNYRFNKLIRSIPLNVVSQKFCTKMLSDQEVKKQIYSLHLRHMLSNSIVFLNVFT